MKKVLTIVCLSLLLGCLTSCGKNNTINEKQKNSIKSEKTELIEEKEIIINNISNSSIGGESIFKGSSGSNIEGNEIIVEQGEKGEKKSFKGDFE